jgi:opacity protein-like surface antigen
MGDLSIVIEDESNMINLWDFAHNPAAFLYDEKGSVLRGDFVWEAHQIDSLPFYEHLVYYYQDVIYLPPFKFQADGDLYDTWGFISSRREGDLAVGLGGDYLLRQTDSERDKNRIERPDFEVVVSKSINSRTSCGAGMKYLSCDFEYTRAEDSWTREGIEDVQAEVGVRSRFSPGFILGATAGYKRVETTGYYYGVHFNTSPTSRIVWVSGQSVMEVVGKIKLATEWTVQILNNKGRSEGNKRRYCLGLRALYRPFSRLRLGLYFSDGDSHIETHDPVYSYYSTIRDWTSTRELGGGFALRLGKDVLTGIEYHYSDYPQPRYNVYYPGNLRTHSIHAGLETQPSEALFFRAGYINSTVVWKPNPLERRNGWETALTLGLGFEPLESGLIFELSYRYILEKHKDCFYNWDVESRTRIFSLSVKKRFWD